MLQVIAARGNRIDLRLIDVKAENGQTALMKRVRERKSDVAEADDADARFAAFDAGKEN